jgi:histidine ammonia-lyase
MSTIKVVEVGEALDIASVVAVARHNASVEIGSSGRSALQRARAVVDGFLQDTAVARYGINTGFGALAETRISNDDLSELQHRLIRSHAVGVGEPLSREATRGLMLLRAHVLCLGYSGVREIVVERLVALLNAGVHPVIPSKGSVGASGDLAPLAHLALTLIGEGPAEYRGEILEGGDALSAVGLEPLRLDAKEGLALINGTQGMLAIGSLVLDRAVMLTATADVTGAMSLEALKGSVGPFDSAIVDARPHPGALATAAHLRTLLEDSHIIESHHDCDEVQDAYSLRCMPQVHGSARDLLAFAEGVVNIELNSATDNPLILPDGRIQSGGNFHGQPVAAALDVATMALADLGSIAERRLAQMVDPSLNRGLPPFLALNSGLNSGFMMAQVTAAALVCESRALCQPKSVDTIPTSADREDHVSMGMISARHLEMVTDHLEHILSIEAVVAQEGIRQRALSAGRGVQAAVERLAECIPPVTEDRPFYRDFEAARQVIASGELLKAADAS